jgi:hypothetical protein
MTFHRTRRSHIPDYPEWASEQPPPSNDRPVSGARQHHTHTPGPAPGVCPYSSLARRITPTSTMTITIARPQNP